MLDAHDKIKVPPGTTSSQPGPKDIIRTDSSTYSSTNWLRLYYLLLLYYSSCETERMASAFHTHVQVITPSMLCRSSAEEPDLPLSCERLRRIYLYTIRTYCSTQIQTRKHVCPTVRISNRLLCCSSSRRPATGNMTSHSSTYVDHRTGRGILSAALRDPHDNEVRTCWLLSVRTVQPSPKKTYNNTCF